MAHTHSGGHSFEPDETGGGVPDLPEFWGNNGLVGNGRYRLTGRLGSGGMAEVFAAEDVRLGRTVAVKLLRSDLSEDPVSKARFTREAQSVAGLNHHAVVAVYDSGEDITASNSTISYIVMELVEGHTIRDLLHSAEPPPPDQALIIVSGVLEALAYSHQHGIVHRDIKPGNVIITHEGAVKVMDFGIARALHGAQNTMTQTGMVMGTPQYLSPEQALGKTIDARSDLYAVGCLLYELLALRPPFVGETPLSVVYQHVQDQARPPSEVCQSSPPELDGLAMRSLAKEPDDRFQTAEEMRGLVQYALRMLQEQGGHTGGLWNTGPVTSGGTPAMGTHSSGGTGTPPRGTPLLPPHNGDDTGGFAGGHRGESRGGGLKFVLLAFCAVLAIAGGIFFALQNDDEPKDDPKLPSTSSSPKPTEDKTTQEPEPDDETEDPTPEFTESDDWTSPEESPSSSPTESDTEPSPTPTNPTDSPTDDSQGAVGESDGGSTDEGSVEGGDEGGAIEGTVEGGDVEGGAAEGGEGGADNVGGQSSGSGGSGDGGNGG